MELLVYLLEFRVRHMGIDLSGRYRSMSEKFLDSTDIRTVGEQGSGETMSERMSGNLFYDIRPERVFFDFVGDEEPTESYIRVGKRFFYNIISLG